MGHRVLAALETELLARRSKTIPRNSLTDQPRFYNPTEKRVAMFLDKNKKAFKMSSQGMYLCHPPETGVHAIGLTL